jgi:signal transduction histidine kinase
LATKKGVTLTENIPDESCVVGDANILATVVRNLLTNAVKFTPAGGTVTLDITPIDRRGKACLTPSKACPTPTPTNPTGYVVSVSDTGIGMSSEQVATLRATSLPVRSRQGTSGEQGSGLGLIVCRELLEKHGTTLQVESEEGKGSRFWFEV